MENIMSDEFESFMTEFLKAAVFLLSFAAIPLLGHVGTRFLMKIVNRGVGK